MFDININSKEILEGLIANLNAEIASNNPTDILLDLQLLDEAIHKKESFSKGFSDKGILQFINRKSTAMANQIALYRSNDAMMVHWEKKRLLDKIQITLAHLASVSKHDENYSQFNQAEYIKILDDINEKFNQYCKYGSVYLMRHCDKESRKNMSGNPYTGIKKAAVKEQAMLIAENMFREALMSPKKVMVTLYYTEMDRTRIFTDIIMHKLMQVNHYGENKVQIVEHSINENIKFSNWSKEALDEMLPLLTDSAAEIRLFLDWLDNTGVVKDMKHQPNPVDVTNKVVNFIRDCHNNANKDDGYYHMVIAVSHAWVIDVAMHKLIPNFRSLVPRIINTAEFCKAECGEFGFGNKWVKLE